ncbi:CHAP domain-containing protein [Staphylococcus devriesei]|uniref:CHAP domain-containing protein n=1 Tax=Staphylococcus devriesei TaxID=586733 RepID=A0A2K4DH35_9STAP|nr:CHAP domain-containing protein [Staphylococcus devriesei]MCE5090066.1 CHAP domain-containing protein [Staphylococcus devriesei]MCE5097846.1 CHAP domain-containing protein [Staphylococcus devriesei]PNZ85764.1 CHAP domain-containing protein [Staphylococcus devriesei]PTF03577.1 CHAP domain-containing protein [Staphylococcus devriesei]PTF14013.1 CHAP domain-containing protein [Staphylococcus devriesei]
MKKIATATIATAGVATIAIAGHGHEAHAAEQGYNPNDPTSYSYSYTIDQQGNYHYTWKGNWSPDQVNHSSQSNYSNNNYSNNNYNNYNSNYSYSYNNDNNTQSYNSNAQRTGGMGASYSTSDRNIKVTTTTAPSSHSSGVSISNSASSGSNLYTSGQCTYYAYERAGGKIGSTWGNANNWANAAAASGYTVNNSPSAGAILQTSQGAYGHVAYVESVGSDGSVTVSEMNYGHGVGVVTSRTISASQASSYNYIH